MDKEQQIENLFNLNNQMIKEIADLKKSVDYYKQKYEDLIFRLKNLCEQD